MNNPKNQQAEKIHSNAHQTDINWCEACQPSEEKQMKIDEILLKYYLSTRPEQECQKEAKQAIQQLILERMPEGKVPAKESWNGLTHDEVLSYNQAIADVTKVINDLFDERE